MNIYVLTKESSFARRRRVNRMMVFDKKTRVGVVLPDQTWQVIALFAASVLFGVFALARWWMCV